MGTGNNCFIVESGILELQSAAPPTGLCGKRRSGWKAREAEPHMPFYPARFARASPNSQKSYFLLKNNCPSLMRGIERATQR